VIGYPVTGPTPLALSSLLAIAIVAGLSAPILALVLAIAAPNKVAGFAVVKVMNAVNLLPSWRTSSLVRSSSPPESSRHIGRCAPSGRQRQVNLTARIWRSGPSFLHLHLFWPFRSSTGDFCDKDDGIRRTQTVFGAPLVSGRGGKGRARRSTVTPARSASCASEELERCECSMVTRSWSALLGRVRSVPLCSTRPRGARAASAGRIRGGHSHSRGRRFGAAA
jgi:hypothetical protein